MIPLADMLGLYRLPDKTVLCYIHTLQSKVPSAHILGMCKIPGIIFMLQTLCTRGCGDMRAWKNAGFMNGQRKLKRPGEKKIA